MLQFRPNRLCRIELANPKRFFLNRTYAYSFKYTVYLAASFNKLIVLLTLHHNLVILYVDLVLDAAVIFCYSKPVSPLPQT